MFAKKYPVKLLAWKKEQAEKIAPPPFKYLMVQSSLLKTAIFCPFKSVSSIPTHPHPTLSFVEWLECDEVLITPKLS